MPPDRCGCGALHFDLEPERFRQVSAMVSAYTFGDGRAFDSLLAETTTEIVPVLIGAIYAAVALIAELEDRPRQTVLERFCAAAEAMAVEAEAAS